MNFQGKNCPLSSLEGVGWSLIISCHTPVKACLGLHFFELVIPTECGGGIPNLCFHFSGEIDMITANFQTGCVPWKQNDTTVSSMEGSISLLPTKNLSRANDRMIFAEMVSVTDRSGLGRIEILRSTRDD